MGRTNGSKRSVSQHLQTAAAIGAVVLLYVLFGLIGIGCPIRFVTGISCLGCGMSRAWLCLLRLDFAGAFYYHPGFFLPPIAVFVFLLKKRLPKAVYSFLMLVLFLAFVLLYFARLRDAGNDIVVFRPEENLLFRTLDFFRQKENGTQDVLSELRKAR